MRKAARATVVVLSRIVHQLVALLTLVGEACWCRGDDWIAPGRFGRRLVIGNVSL